MAFRYLIYSTGTTYAETIIRESAVDDPNVNEASLFSDFVIPEIQPLYLWRVTGGTDVVPNIDSNIEEYLNTINPPSPDDYVLYGIFTGYTAQTQTDLAGKVDTTIFNAFTAQTQTDLAGKINIVTGATGNVGIFTVDGNLEDSGFAISGLTGGSGQDVYVSGMTYVGSTLTLQRTEGFPDLQVSIVTSGASDGVVSGGTLSGTILSLQRTEGLPDVQIQLSGLTADIEADIITLSGQVVQNTTDITNITNSISGLTGQTFVTEDTFTGYTATTDVRLEAIEDVTDIAITGATNGLTKSGRDVLLGGTLTQTTQIDGNLGTYDLDILNLDQFNLSFNGISKIFDNGSNGGIHYNADYSANFIDRSLVDKAYVDAVAAGADWKESSRVATTTGETDIDLTGGTFAGVIDGVSLADGDRVLIKNQNSAQEENGIYVWSASTSAFTRSTDFDGTPAGEVTAGAVTFIEEGTINASSSWVLVTNDPITVGVTPLVFSYFSNPSQLTAGVGIDITSNVISLDGAAVAGDFLQWTGTQFNVTGLTSFEVFSGYTAATSVVITNIQTDISTISGDVITNTNNIALVSGQTIINENNIITLSGDVENLYTIVSGLTAATYVTFDEFTGYTATTDIRITNIETDITTISGDVVQNTTDIATISGDVITLSGEVQNKIDKVTGATGNLGQFTVDGNLEDTGFAISGLTGSSATPAIEIQLVSTGVTDINTIVATAIDWHIADFSGASYIWSGGSGIFITETGDYEVSYHLTAAQVGGGQPRSVGAYLILNNTETLDRTSSATHIAAADHKGSLICPPTVFSFTAGDRLDLAAFRIGGTGTVNTTAFETVILIKKKGTLV